VRALFKRGVIRAIRASLDERQLGYAVMSFVSIRLESQASATLQAFETSIAAMPRV
jgi:DNA-binding Lrp family transcriptional regulator